MTEEEVWQLVVDNAPLLRSLVAKRLPRHRRAELDDIYSDVVYLRAHSIMRLFDPTRGVKPITYLARNVEWYAFERIIYRKYKKQILAESLDSAVSNGVAVPTISEDATIQVHQLMDSLPELARDLLRWKHCRGNDVEEIAAHMGISRKEARELIVWAEGLARDTADGVTRRGDQFASYGHSD